MFGFHSSKKPVAPIAAPTAQAISQALPGAGIVATIKNEILAAKAMDEALPFAKDGFEASTKAPRPVNPPSKMKVYGPMTEYQTKLAAKKAQLGQTLPSSGAVIVPEFASQNDQNLKGALDSISPKQPVATKLAASIKSFIGTSVTKVGAAAASLWGAVVGLAGKIYGGVKSLLRKLLNNDAKLAAKAAANATAFQALPAAGSVNLIKNETAAAIAPHALNKAMNKAMNEALPGSDVVTLIASEQPVKAVKTAEAAANDGASTDGTVVGSDEEQKLA